MERSVAGTLRVSAWPRCLLGEVSFPHRGSERILAAWSIASFYVWLENVAPI